jgi:hypothetical protein
MTAEAEIENVVSPLVSLRLTVSNAPWRLGPAWAVGAGLLAMGGSLSGSALPLRVVGAACLADLAWGVLWSPHAAGSGRFFLPPLPFVSCDSPLARGLRELSRMTRGMRWQELATALAIIIGLSLLLGWQALALSGLAVAVAFGAAGREASRGPAHLLRMVLMFGLPWALGMSVGASATGVNWTRAMMLGSAWMLVVWGQVRSNGRLHWLVWMGQGSVLAVLAWFRVPWAALLVAALLATPTVWMAAQGGSRAVIAKCAPWWWIAMWVSAIGMR